MLGAGKVGLVLAESLRKRGAEVSIVESEKRIAGDVMPSFKWRHSAWVEELGIRTYTSARVVAIAADGVTIESKGGQTQLPADTVIAATPRRSNQELLREFEWMIDELHACGDVVMPRGLDAAIQEGYRLGVRI
jgi:2,4-dienoyl-CoA reductase (NADPH2)